VRVCSWGPITERVGVPARVLPWGWGVPGEFESAHRDGWVVLGGSAFCVHGHGFVCGGRR